VSAILGPCENCEPWRRAGALEDIEQAAKDLEHEPLADD
jgi:hypothetical protein